jgi:hypothetical protein
MTAATSRMSASASSSSAPPIQPSTCLALRAPTIAPLSRPDCIGLQRIDVADGLRSRELRDIVIREADCADFPLGLEIEQRLPVQLDRRIVLRRPVHLVQIDALDLEPLERGLEFPAQARRRADALGLCIRSAMVADEAALGAHLVHK